MFGNVYAITFDKEMFREKIVNVVGAQENTNFDIYLPGTNEIYISQLHVLLQLTCPKLGIIKS